MRYAYPAVVEVAADGATITFPDVPGAISAGADEAEALRQGADALVSVLADMCDRGEALPVPSAARGRPMVSVSVMEAAKLALNEAMRVRRVSNVDLGRLLNADEKAVRRLRDVLHVSRMPDVERALAALGKRLTIEVRDAA
ncbi:MAG TPA: type II toxin-antitoxin system HicB family antitoxin [Roseomonas sp.]|jgi:antitoxin HicB